MYVCLCKGITDSQIRQAIEDGAETVGAVRQQLGVATQCGKCSAFVRDLIQETLAQPSSGDLFYNVA